MHFDHLYTDMSVGVASPTGTLPMNQQLEMRGRA